MVQILSQKMCPKIYRQLMTGYGTDMRPKNLLKNVEAAHDRIWNKFETKKMLKNVEVAITLF